MTTFAGLASPKGLALYRTKKLALEVEQPTKWRTARPSDARFTFTSEALLPNLKQPFDSTATRRPHPVAPAQARSSG